jgi:hypothetical protein
MMVPEGVPEMSKPGTKTDSLNRDLFPAGRKTEAVLQGPERSGARKHPTGDSLERPRENGAGAGGLSVGNSAEPARVDCAGDATDVTIERHYIRQ